MADVATDPARLRAMLAAAEGTMVREGWCWAEGAWVSNDADDGNYLIRIRPRVYGGDRPDRSPRLTRPYARCRRWNEDLADYDGTDLGADTILECIEAAEAWLKEQGAIKASPSP